jgi:exopolysaccharide/PEP-CTERM locus tyrosine autokinase
VSLLENALKKLQGARTTTDGSSPGAAATRNAAASVVPAARRKKVSLDGPKYHVSQSNLIKAGLLAPIEQAVPVADEFRKIKRPLIVTAFGGTPLPGHANVIMITSPLPKAGKTFCSVNLAVSMSLERDLNVLLVDADVAKPHITREFGLTDRPGLIDLLVDDRGDLNKMLVRTDLNDIQILPAGRTHPQATELIASDRMSAIVTELATRYSDRIILLDSPPLLITSEAQALASQVGQITLIVEAGATTHQQLAQTIEMLDRDKSINVVLNKSHNLGWVRGGDYSGEYGYGYEPT